MGVLPAMSPVGWVWREGGGVGKFLGDSHPGIGLGEAVAFAADGGDVFRGLLVFFQLLAEPGDVDVDCP